MKNKKIIILAIIIIAAIIVVYFSGIQKFLTFEKFLANKESMLQFVNKNYLLATLIYIIGYIIIVISSLPLAGPLNIIGGFLFGLIPGTIYTIIGSTIGATSAFILFRHLFGKRIQNKYGDKLKNFNENINRYGAIYLLSIQFTGLLPFFVINSLAAVTNISLGTFIWTTALGIIPITLVYSYSGQQLSKINSVGEIFSGKMMLAFLLLAFLSLISVFIKRYKFNKKSS